MATEPAGPPDARTLVGLLADADRRAVFAALVLGASTLDAVRAATHLDERAATTALGRLVSAGLVTTDGGNLVMAAEVFGSAARAAAAREPDPEVDTGGLGPEDAKVLRSFVRKDRLLSIPAQHSKRRVVLDRLAQEFEPGRRYTEGEVNGVLRRWHDDTASLRRYLVDEEFLLRDAGEYWRAGGTFPVDE